MSVWPRVRLDACAEIISGATPKTSVSAYWGGDICWVTPKELSDLDGAYIGDTPRKITLGGLSSCGASILPPGSVLFSSRAPIGHVAINTVPMATNQGFKSFLPQQDKLHSKFLYHWLRWNRTYLEGLGNGATFKEVSKAVVACVEIPLPPLPEQRRIAAILDQADALRAKRREALARLDELTQAIFLEMFGDPATNPKGWELKRIMDVATVHTGNTPPRKVRDYYGNDIEWIKSDNINTPEYYLTPAEEGLSALGRGVARVVPAGAILVTCIAGSKDCIGNAAMTDREVAFNQQINGIIPTCGNSHFVYAQLRVGKKLIQRASTNGMKGIVSKSRFEQVELIWPPESLQQFFADQVLSATDLADTQQASLVQLDALFASLQHRAFRGEL